MFDQTIIAVSQLVPMALHLDLVSQVSQFCFINLSSESILELAQLISIVDLEVIASEHFNRSELHYWPTNTVILNTVVV